MKSVVITGGTRGIGRGLAEQFLKRGNNVAISGRSKASLIEAIDELAGKFPNQKIVGSVCDIRDASSIEILWKTAVKTFGTVDIWINNAGMSINRAPLIEQSAEDISAIVGTNLTGALLASQIALQGFTKQGHGQLWNMEGFGSDGMAQPGMAAYGCTKRAVNYLTKALLKETKGGPLQICVISPGIVATDLLIGDYDTSSEAWQKTKRILNILGDKVETVTPWLANQILTTDKTGSRVVWLTKRKAFARFMTSSFNSRDIFEGMGV